MGAGLGAGGGRQDTQGSDEKADPETIGRGGSLEYSEILRRLGLKSTGKLNYHLKLLAPYLEKDDQGRNRLNSEGVSLYRLLVGLGMASTYSLWRAVAVLMLSAAAVLGVFAWVLARPAVGGEYSSWGLRNAAFSVALVLVCLAAAFYMEEPESKADPSIPGLVRINLFPFLLLLALIMLAESQPPGTTWRSKRTLCSRQCSPGP